MTDPQRSREVPISVADLWDRLLERNGELEALVVAQAAQLETVRQENEDLKKELLARVDTTDGPSILLPQPALGDK